MNTNLRMKSAVDMLLLTLLWLSGPSIAIADSAYEYGDKGRVGVEATIGLAAGYGLIGVAVDYGITDNLGLGVSTGVDILNTHYGVHGKYQLLPAQKYSPFIYAGLSRSYYKSEHSDYASVGGGLEIEFESGFYFAGAAGFAFYTDGANGEGNGPGFFELRPISVGLKF